ncbi:MAG: penicillin-binding protein 1C [Rubrivivax sp.]|nr:penicillin-binding protein 1C [Rubrivivax sp.]
MAASARRCARAAWVVALPIAWPAGALALPAFDAVRAAHRPSDLPLLDRHGTPIASVRVDPLQRRGPWVPLAEVSPALRDALLRSEDRSFWAHGGVDWSALAAGAWARAWNTHTRGASTVTMQLAALLDPELARPAGGRGLADKLAQMRAAQQLEARWTKAQILEAYLNAVPLRGELTGIAAAADQLFGKHASGLDAEESALLAALVRAPNAEPGAVQRRACALLRAPQGSCATLDSVAAQAFARAPGPWRVLGGEMLAPHLARQAALAVAAAPAAATMRAPAAVPAASAVPRAAAPPWAAAAPAALPRTTLDARVQRMALAALRRQLAELRGRGADDGAVVVLDNASGEVLAWVGSAAAPIAGAAAGDVDAVLARRQPGSTIKPFVYALALERRLVTAASVLDDAPLELAAGSGLYRPANYDHRFRGAVSVRTALASSLNVPAVRVAALLGPDAVFERLAALGLRPQQSAGHHGHALALGSADATLLDLANAYRALARGGRTSRARWWADQPRAAERTVFDAGAAWLVADILADSAARAAAFGLDSPLVTRGWAAVKTGTSKDMRDNWCVGFSARYTVGVWVGNAGGAPMQGVSGVAGAAPVWRELLAWLHADAPSRAPAPPAALHAEGGEWFLAGTSAPPAGAGAARRLGIASPREGSLVALDPEIPAAMQRMVFEGAPGRWSVDGRLVGEGARVRWQPHPGRHLLERRDAESVDRVRFEVRAAPPPRPVRAAPTRPKG